LIESRVRHRARPVRAIRRVGKVCAIETGLSETTVRNIFVSSLKSRELPDGRRKGWSPRDAPVQAALEDPSRVVAVGEAQPRHRAPAIACIVTDTHSRSRLEVYIGPLAPARPGPLARIYVARQLYRASQLLLQYDDSARSWWPRAVETPFDQLVERVA
jgi:hypothetical protein